MIDFKGIDKEYLTEVMNITQKNVEMSSLNLMSIYTINPKEKAEIFVFCHRFLNTIYKIIDDTEDNKISLKSQIKKEIELTKDKYYILYNATIQLTRPFNRNKYMRIINNEILKDSLVDDLIDSFAVLLERTNMIQVSKIQGFVLEGKSKEEFIKAFRKEDKRSEEVVATEEELVDDTDETSEKDNNETEKEDNQKSADEEAETPGEEKFQEELSRVEAESI